MILHCMKKKDWERVKNASFFGQNDLERYGFIHCSPIEYFWRVTWLFKEIDEALVLLKIDENKLDALVKWEDGDNCGREYPHIYGLINTNAVISVLPYLKDANGEWIKNAEFKNIDNR